jgi:NDP-sugar pyrophosphorylase family protein
MTLLPPIAVLAGGMATRMKPLTETLPKSMLEVAGEPFIAHQLRLFAEKGIGRVVLCVGHLGETIRDFVGTGERFGLDIGYAFDGARLLGTGGALRQALPMLGEEFLVTYGDSYLDADYGFVVDAFRASSAPAMMTVFRNANRWGTSNVEFIDGRIVDYTKQPTPQMTHIDYGLSILKAAVFADMPDGAPFDLASLYRRLIQENLMIGLEVSQRFYEIGSQAGLCELDALLRASCVKDSPR